MRPRVWRAIAKSISYIVLSIWVVFTLFPIYWAVITSFKPPIAVFAGPTYVPFVDFRPNLDAWKLIFKRDWPEVSLALANSIVVSVLSASFALIAGCLCSFGLTRFKFQFKNVSNKDILFWIVSQRMMIPVALVIPIMVLFKSARLIDTRAGLILLYTTFNLPFAVWLLKDFFSGVPRELEEAAKVDGCSTLQAFYKVLLPIARPGLVASFLFCLVFAWNEFLFALSLTFQRAQTMTVLIAGQNSNRGPEWWAISALVLLTIAPVLIITFALERYIVRGLSMGAVKQ